MVKFQFTLWLYAFTTGVQALNQAVPYELLYMYSVYKAEYRVFPAGARTVASGCQHTVNLSPTGQAFEAAAAAAGVSGICTFDEFVKEVGSQGTLGKLAWADSGRSLNPDPDTVAERIIRLGWSVTKGTDPDPKSKAKSLLYWPSKLLPQAGYPTGTGRAIVQVPLPEILQGILNAAQNARREASVRGGVVGDFVNSCISDAQKFLRIGNQFRLSDQSRFFKTYLNGLPETVPFKNYVTTEATTIKKVDGVTSITDKYFSMAKYQSMDWDTTWATSWAHTTDAQRLALLQRCQGFGASSPISQVHQNVIDMQHFSTDLLSGNDLDCRQRKRRRAKLMTEDSWMQLAPKVWTARRLRI